MLPHRSLFTVLTIAIILAVSAIMGARAYLHYSLESKKIVSQIAANVEKSKQNVSSNIIPLIQSYAVNEYTKVLRNEIETSDYKAVILLDKNMSDLTGGQDFYVGFINQGTDLTPFEPSLPHHREVFQNCLKRTSFFPLDVDSGKKIGFLLICSSDKQVEAERVKTIEETLIETIATALVLLVLIYAIVMHFSVRPIRKIVSSLEEQDELQLPAHPVQGNGFAEIDFLANKINEMVETARTSNTQIMSERKKLADIIWGTDIGTWEWNVQTGETEFNEKWANIIGYTLDELAPINIETWINFAHPEDILESENLLNKCFMKEAEYYEFECRMKHKDGHWVWVLDRGKVVEWTADDKPLRMAGTHTDVSYRKEIEQNLENARKEAIQANTAKSDFLANMSHELRTPMTGIRGVLDLFKENKKIAKEAGELLDDLDVSANVLMRLLNDVLDLSKIEAGKVELEYRPYKPAKIINGIANTFAAIASKRDIVLEANTREYKDYYCSLDELRFRQIISNLVSNAVKFTTKGSISIDMEVQEGARTDTLIVTVSDTGIGMTKDAIQNIFQRFEQADNSTTRKYGGTGLGLAISKELAGLFGGNLTIESEVDIGSKFILTIDVSKAEAPTEENDVFELSKINVLLAEDNKVNQNVLRAMFEKQGHSITTANNGLEAVKHASEMKFDVILMDMQMPEMDGEEATRLIRYSDNPNCNQPILAFTADAVKEHKDRFLKAGVDGVVLKPVKWDVLQEQIRHALGKHQ